MKHQNSKQSKSIKENFNMGPVCQDVLQNMVESLSIRNVTVTRVTRKSMEYIINEHMDIEVNAALANAKYSKNGITPENIGELISRISSLQEYMEEYEKENVVRSIKKEVVVKKEPIFRVIKKEFKPVIKKENVFSSKKTGVKPIVLFMDRKLNIEKDVKDLIKKEYKHGTDEVIYEGHYCPGCDSCRFLNEKLEKSFLTIYCGIKQLHIKRIKKEKM